MNAPSAQRRIVLTGFMCAGKTTVARALAARLGWAMLDTDARIVGREGRSIEAIIEGDGEPRFRQIEQDALRDALANSDGGRIVIAVGGGAWMLAENRALINAHGCLSVWLDAPFELCWQRIAGSADTRPLARDRDSARELYDARRALYSLADLHVRIGVDESPEAIALTIISALGQLPQSSKK